MAKQVKRVASVYRIEGDVQVTEPRPIEPDDKRAEKVFDLELWLNGEIASRAQQKFGLYPRFHLRLR